MCQVSTGVPLLLPEESPTTLTCHLFQAVLGVIWADQAALLVVTQQADQAALPSPSMSLDVMGLQSAEQENSTARASHALGKGSRTSCWSLHCNLLFLCVIGLLPSLCAGGRALGCLAVDYGHTAECIQSQLSNSISASLMLCHCCFQRPLHASLLTFGDTNYTWQRACKINLHLFQTFLG